MAPKNIKKMLPKPDDYFHLSDDGYNTFKSKLARQSSLRKSATKHGSLKVMQRLNLIKNLSRQSKSKNIMKKDVDYLKKLYSREKKRNSKTLKKSTKRKNKKTSKNT